MISGRPKKQTAFTLITFIFNMFPTKMGYCLRIEINHMNIMKLLTGNIKRQNIIKLCSGYLGTH